MGVGRRGPPLGCRGHVGRLLGGAGQSCPSPDLAHPSPLHPQKFLFFVLKSSDVLDILVPILYFLNDARADQCKAGVGSGSLGGAPRRGAAAASLSCPLAAQALCPDLPGRASPHTTTPRWVPAPGSLPPCPTQRGDPPTPRAAARVGLMHIGVFILLLLSGERNFGVRLNKPYSVRVPMDIPVFTGTHADLLIVVSQGGTWKSGGDVPSAETGGSGDPVAEPLLPT